MATPEKQKQRGTKLSHPDLKMSVKSKKPQKVSKGQVRLSLDDKTRQSATSLRSRKSSGQQRKSVTQDETEPDEEEQVAPEEVEDSQPLDPEKSKEKAKVLKNFLENKYKIEYPKVEGELEKNDEFYRPPTDKEILANNGLDMDFSQDEQIQLLKLYEKLEEGIEQAEEFFRSIGIEWNSELQMYKVKPKKFMPAMTMIAFGPDYDDVIVCKDNEETGETQACVLSKDNKDCPKDVTTVSLNVFKDGFQPEDDEFYAYSSDSIRDFFQKNIGSYIIMKPNDDMPQTILIRVVDERERSFEEVRKDRAQGVPKQKPKPKKKMSKGREHPGKQGNIETPSEQDEAEGRPKYYTQPTIKTTSMSETVEIFERHKIIKRLEDMPIEDDGMGPSSWCWKNQRNPLSSEYVVPPNITTTTFDTDGTNEECKPVVGTNAQSAGQNRQFPIPVPPVDEAVKTKVEKSTSVTNSLFNTGLPIVVEPPPTALAPANAAVVSTPQPANQITPAEQRPQQVNHSETNINKINIFHGPVTVINLGDGSEDSVRISPQPDNKFKVSSRRPAKKKSKEVKEEEEEYILSSFEWNNFVQSEERKLKDFEEVTPHSQHENLEPPWGISNNPMNYETEYDSAYNQSAAKWSDFITESAKRKSAAATDLTNATFEHITLLGHEPPPKPEKKISVLLDLGGITGKRESVEGVELNKKTSDTQITVALRDNNSGKKYLVNIYPEEQLKKIWSVLKLNNIAIQNVTPELVLGTSEWQQNKPTQLPATSTKEPETSTKEPETLKINKEVKDDVDDRITPLPKTKIEADVISKTSQVTGKSQERENESDKSDETNLTEEKPPSIQSDVS